MSVTSAAGAGVEGSTEGEAFSGHRQTGTGFTAEAGGALEEISGQTVVVGVAVAGGEVAGGVGDDHRFLPAAVAVLRSRGCRRGGSVRQVQYSTVQ